jgi:capsular polysaccharide biosynthesis protein
MNMKDKNDEIDIIEILSVIWSSKFFIASLTFLFLFFSVLYSISLTNIYTSSALLQINDSNENDGLSSLNSQFGGFASIAGISLPSSGPNKSDYAIETIKSRDFVRHLLQFKGVTENLIAAKSFDRPSKKIIYDSNTYDSVSNKWVREVPLGREKIPSYLEIYPIYNDLLNVSVDSESGFIYLSFSHLSPIFAKDFLDLVIDELNAISKIKDLEESGLALDFLQDQLLTVQQTDMRKTLNAMVETQLKTKMLVNVRKDYLVSAIDSSFIPEIRSSPSRLIICVLGAFFGIVFSILIVLMRFFTFSKS